MQEKQYLLLINKKSQGMVMPFPRLLDLPATKQVGNTVYERTNRKKTYPEYKAIIYLERGADLDINNFADPEEVTLEEVKPIVAALDSPTELITAPVQEIANKIAAPTGVETRIYGRSDDLIEFDGGYSGEVGCYGTDDRDKGVLIVISDGTALEVKYGKGGQGIWGITVLKKGTAYAGFEPCDDEDEDIYSDIVTLRGDIKYAYAATDWEKVQ